MENQSNKKTLKKIARVLKSMYLQEDTDIERALEYATVMIKK